jgi:hypothetical protein
MVTHPLGSRTLVQREPPRETDRGRLGAMRRKPAKAPPVKGQRRPAPTRDHGQAVAPFFSLARAAWIPYAITWDPETGALRGVEGPRGSATYRAARGSAWRTME